MEYPAAAWVGDTIFNAGKKSGVLFTGDKFGDTFFLSPETRGHLTTLLKLISSPLLLIQFHITFQADRPLESFMIFPVKHILKVIPDCYENLLTGLVFFFFCYINWVHNEVMFRFVHTFK